MAEKQQQQRPGRRRRVAAATTTAAAVAPPKPTRHRQPPPTLLLLACLALLLLPSSTLADNLPDNSPADFPQSEAVQSTRPIVARQWRAHLSRVSALATGGPRSRSVGDLLGPVLTEWEYALPLPQVRKSLVYAGGANARLRRVVHDLLVGAGAGSDATAKPTIKVGAIGGSITHGAKASRMGENDWFSLVGTYMRAAFPNANVVVRNGALPATPSALMNMCLETYVDEDVDLVFVEVRERGVEHFQVLGRRKKQGSETTTEARRRAPTTQRALSHRNPPKTKNKKQKSVRRQRRPRPLRRGQAQSVRAPRAQDHAKAPQARGRDAPADAERDGLWPGEPRKGAFSRHLGRYVRSSRAVLRRPLVVVQERGVAPGGVSPVEF